MVKICINTFVYFVDYIINTSLYVIICPVPVSKAQPTTTSPLHDSELVMRRLQAPVSRPWRCSELKASLWHSDIKRRLSYFRSALLIWEQSKSSVWFLSMWDVFQIVWKAAQIPHQVPEKNTKSQTLHQTSSWRSERNFLSEIQLDDVKKNHIVILEDISTTHKPKW